VFVAVSHMPLVQSSGSLQPVPGGHRPTPAPMHVELQRPQSNVFRSSHVSLPETTPSPHGSQLVSDSAARSPASFVSFAPHATHMFMLTRWSIPQITDVQLVSPVAGSSPPALVDPEGQATHLPPLACQLTSQTQRVLPPAGSSPPALLVPVSHATQPPPLTR
jgi:hypothetical protein